MIRQALLRLVQPLGSVHEPHLAPYPGALLLEIEESVDSGHACLLPLCRSMAKSLPVAGPGGENPASPGGDTVPRTIMICCRTTPRPVLVGERGSGAGLDALPTSEGK